MHISDNYKTDDRVNMWLRGLIWYLMGGLISVILIIVYSIMHTLHFVDWYFLVALWGFLFGYPIFLYLTFRNALFLTLFIIPFIASYTWEKYKKRKSGSGKEV